MTSPEGGFFSAEDADSLVPGGDPNHPEKKEGAFYVFSAAELKSILGKAAEAFALRYGVEESGNAEDPHGELTGQNVLFVAREIEEVARRLGVPAADANQTIEGLGARSSRLAAAAPARGSMTRFSPAGTAS